MREERFLWVGDGTSNTSGLSCISCVTFILPQSPIQVMHGYLFRQERSFGPITCPTLEGRYHAATYDDTTRSYTADKGTPEEDIHLALPGLLPANHTLVVNPEKRIVVMRHDEPGC